MIKSFNNTDKLKLNVFLKNGDEFLGRDLSTTANDNLIAFWDEKGTVIISVPISEIAKMELFEERD